MATLYLTEQGSILRKTSDRLIVEKDGTVLLEVPCLKIETVLIFGNVQVTTQALAELLEHGIELALLSTSGKLRGQLTPPKAKNIPLRMRQYEMASSETSCLEIARRLVGAKIENTVAVLRRFRRNHPEALSPAEVEEVARGVPAVAQAQSLETLRGLEGAAAARYFALLDGMGFDPYLGFFHQIDYGRPSLALDLLEEFRAPLIDSFTLGLLNRRVLAADAFHATAEGGVLLHREAMKTYFSAYEKALTTPVSLGEESLTYRQLFRRQAERLARALVAGEPYEPFRLPC